RVLRITPDRVYRMVASGELHALRIGKVIRIPKSSLEAFGMPQRVMVDARLRPVEVVALPERRQEKSATAVQTVALKEGRGGALRSERYHAGPAVPARLHESLRARVRPVVHPPAGEGGMNAPTGGEASPSSSAADLSASRSWTRRAGSDRGTASCCASTTRV